LDTIAIAVDSEATRRFWQVSVGREADDTWRDVDVPRSPGGLPYLASGWTLGVFMLVSAGREAGDTTTH
jgi:hypothetical protein